MMDLSGDYRRPLHWVFKIGDLKAAVDTYVNVFGMHILRHEEFDGGCEATCNGPYGGAWSKTMIGYGSELLFTALELTYNYGISSYAKGNDYRHIALLKPLLPPDILDRAKSHNLTIDSTPSGTFITMPHDGYKFLLVDHPYIQSHHPEDPFLHVSLNVSNLKSSVEYYRDALGFTVLKEDMEDKELPRAIVGFKSTKSLKIELVQLKEGVVDHGKAIGRIATETEDNAQEKVEKNVMMKMGGTRDWIVHGPFALPPHNERVIIVRDADGYEMCFVEASGYKKCTAAGTQIIDWDFRENRINKKNLNK